MKPRFGSALLGLAAFIMGATSLHAEEPGWSSAIKVRALLGSTKSDQDMANAVSGGNIQMGGGFGLELGYTVGPGRITGELGYSVMAGDAYLVTTPNPNAQTVIDQSTSVDSRKNKLEGLTLRLGYEAPLSGSLAWRAGLQFGGNKYTHQVLGNINGKFQGNAFADSYYYVGSKSSMAPSPFGGLTYNFDASSALEFGVLLLNYSSLNYQHVVNTKNQADTVSTKSHLVPNFEVAYVFRF